MHKFYFAILLIASTLFASSDLPSCSDVDAYTTKCNPYRTKFLNSTNTAQSNVKTIHNRVITKKIVVSVEKKEIIKTISLNNLIDKYINKQEELYQKQEKNTAIETADEVPPVAEVNESGDKYIVFEVPPTHSDAKEDNESHIGYSDFALAIDNNINVATQIKSTHKKTTNQAKSSQTKVAKKTKKVYTKVNKTQQKIKSLSHKKTTKPTKTGQTKVTKKTKKVHTKADKAQQKTKSSTHKNTTKPTKSSQTKVVNQAKIAQDGSKNKKTTNKASKSKIKKVVKKKPKPKYATYKVIGGDYFAKIASKFGVSKKKLIEINNFNRNKILKIGEKILIPIEDQEYVDSIVSYRYKVKIGDSILKISKRFHVNISDLKKYNHLKKSSVIQVGKILVLPIAEKLRELKAKEALAKKIALRKKRRAEFLRLSSRMRHHVSVTATAYSSTHSQTDSTPFLAAWNNRIKPGMKIIAVSWDLIRKYGITNGTKVRISGLPYIYTVRDKMNKKWRRRIDIYMGVNHRGTIRWGKRRVMLYY